MAYSQAASRCHASGQALLEYTMLTAVVLLIAVAAFGVLQQRVGKTLDYVAKLLLPVEPDDGTEGSVSAALIDVSKLTTDDITIAPGLAAAFLESSEDEGLVSTDVEETKALRALRWADDGYMDPPTEETDPTVVLLMQLMKSRWYTSGQHTKTFLQHVFVEFGLTTT